MAVTFYYRLAGTHQGARWTRSTTSTADNFKWLLVLSVALTLFWLWDQRRKGKLLSL